MIRLIILVAVFFALYPYIGPGFKQFSNDVHIDGFYDIVETVSRFVKETWTRMRG